MPEFQQPRRKGRKHAPQRPASRAGTEFADRYGPSALILGGSEGIGASFARQLAARGLDLTLVGRNRPTLEATASEIRGEHAVDVEVRALDLSGPEVDRFAAGLFDGQEYGLVIYNAGATHGVGRFLDQPVERALALVRLNCIGPIAVAHRALSQMRERKRGGLILVTSMSAMAGSGYVAAYAAAKSFELILAEGLNWELAHEGVDVLCAVATLTDTPAMARSGIKLDTHSGWTPMRPDDVASGALANLGRTPVWFAAGEAAAQAMRTAPRGELIESLSRASAGLWGLEV